MFDATRTEKREVRIRLQRSGNPGGYTIGTEIRPEEDEEEENAAGKSQAAGKEHRRGEVTAQQNRARRGHPRRGQVTWSVTRRVRLTIPRSKKERKARQGIAGGWRGTLSEEVTDGNTKIFQRRSHTRWVFGGERRED